MSPRGGPHFIPSLPSPPPPPFSQSCKDRPPLWPRPPPLLKIPQRPSFRVHKRPPRSHQAAGRQQEKTKSHGELCRSPFSLRHPCQLPVLTVPILLALPRSLQLAPFSHRTPWLTSPFVLSRHPQPLRPPMPAPPDPPCPPPRHQTFLFPLPPSLQTRLHRW